MAIIYPPIEAINKTNPQPTEGERTAIDFLVNTLDDDYEVFFQPFLNGDMPDIIIMRKGGGVYILEVKDWNLNSYNQWERRWYVKDSKGENGAQLESPIDQVYRYKENLYNLHVRGLLERKIDNPKVMSIVSCGIYFHKSTTNQINRFLNTPSGKDDVSSLNNRTSIENREKSFKKYLKWLSYFDVFGKDGLTVQNIEGVMEKRWVSKKSIMFDDDLYDEFKRTFRPPLHQMEKGIEIRYNDKQLDAIESVVGKHQKIRGVVGSGKTMCLAKRAVNAHKRTGEDVLILFFNISLRNYIHDRISDIRENFEWRHFHIAHYHDFFKSKVYENRLKIYGLDDFDSENFFESVKDELKKYNTIVVDEIQDYQRPWVNLIKKYFLKQGGEFVVFGDEKQNIYERWYDQDERKPYTAISGAWKILNVSYRVSTEIAHLAENFQREFYAQKYEFDPITSVGTQLNAFAQSRIEYSFFQEYDGKSICELITSAIKRFGEHDNDVCIQAAKVDSLREIEYLLRRDGRKVMKMFETKEEFMKLTENNGLNMEGLKRYNQIKSKVTATVPIQISDEELLKRVKSLKDDITALRKNRKYHFYNNPGTLKMSTIHSFKGWEVNTLFLIIDDESTE